MNCPLQSKDVKIKTEILPDGAAVKITSKNPEMAKKIREHLDKMESCSCGGYYESDQGVKKSAGPQPEGTLRTGISTRC